MWAALDLCLIYILSNKRRTVVFIPVRHPDWQSLSCWIYSSCGPPNGLRSNCLPSGSEAIYQSVRGSVSARLLSQPSVGNAKTVPAWEVSGLWSCWICSQKETRTPISAVRKHRPLCCAWSSLPLLLTLFVRSKKKEKKKSLPFSHTLPFACASH